MLIVGRERREYRSCPFLLAHFQTFIVVLCLHVETFNVNGYVLVSVSSSCLLGYFAQISMSYLFRQEKKASEYSEVEWMLLLNGLIQITHVFIFYFGIPLLRNVVYDEHTPRSETKDVYQTLTLPSVA